MDVMGALVGVDRLQVHHVTHHMVLVDDAVGAVHIPRGTRNLQRLAAVVALEERLRTPITFPSGLKPFR